jgi:predicted metal-dependent enzyme (double-stranded beta helix superfamily)
MATLSSRSRRTAHIDSSDAPEQGAAPSAPEQGAAPSAPEQGAAPSVPEQGPALWRLQELVLGFAELLASTKAEPVILKRGGQLLSVLIAHDDWLPAQFARAASERYQQYLLHCDSRERFSVVSFVWAPGQETPVHDHRVWGLVGVLRGAEYNESFARNERGELVARGVRERLERGAVSAVSPSIGDLHRVSNADPHAVSISIHVYGANIGAVRRASYDAAGAPKPFVSGYANSVLPNIWQHPGQA